jgi:hypothetical protein
MEAAVDGEDGGGVAEWFEKNTDVEILMIDSEVIKGERSERA